MSQNKRHSLPFEAHGSLVMFTLVHARPVLTAILRMVIVHVPWQWKYCDLSSSCDTDKS